MSDGLTNSLGNYFASCGCASTGKSVVVCDKHKLQVGIYLDPDRKLLQDKIDGLIESNRSTNIQPKPLVNVALKFDTNKIPVELLPTQALEEVAKVLAFGAKKYDSWNWAKGFKWTRLIGAAIRHIFAYQRGEDKDSESGLSHIAHAACCLLFLLQHELSNLGEDDRYKEFNKGDKQNGI